MKNVQKFSACLFAVVAFALVAPVATAESESKGSGFLSQIFTKRDEAGLDAARKRETLVAQLQRIEQEIAKLEQKLGATDDEDEIDDIEDDLEVFDFIEGLASETLASNPNEKDLLSANTLIARIFAASDDPAPTGPLKNILVKLGRAGRLIGGATFGNRIPRVSAAKQSKAMGLGKAKDESVYLFDTTDRSFFSTEQLAGMTPEEVSRLDVSPEHPAWYRDDVFAPMRSSRLKGFENWMQAGVTAALRAKGDLGRGGTWEMHSARKVLFLDDIYMDATSPKGTTEDVFGVEWKIKWGDEIQAEPVSSRLYLLAGAKITDGNYFSGYGPDAMVLVLNKPGKYKNKEAENGAKRSPETLGQLNQTLLDFYGFDLTPYIHSYGVITEANIGRILRNLPSGGKDKYDRDKLIGREWVSFRESMLELKPKGFIRRYESSQMSDLAAVNDRSARGLYLFALWITNRDCKDDNNKSYFIKEPSADGNKMEITTYWEGLHDMGSTLGSLMSSARINRMTTGKNFASKSLFGASFKFRQSLLYRPKAWKVATWADEMWMARKITSITEPQIREAVSYSGWPDFMQEALVYKLLDRRNRIGELFDLTGDLDHYPVAAPTISVPLRTDDEIRAAEIKYGLVSGSLAAQLAYRKIMPGYVDTVISKGQVVDCKGSVLVGLITYERHPSGLYDRYSRFGDTMPETCIKVIP